MSKDKNSDYSSEGVVRKLFQNNNLLDFCLEIERLFDDFNLYAYDNWFDGVIVEGPDITKYWVSLILKFPYKQMPAPRGGKMLLNNGIKVDYEQSEENVPVKMKTPSDFRDGSKKPKMEKKKIWLVTLVIPRALVDIGNITLKDLETIYDTDLEALYSEGEQNEQEADNGEETM